MQKKKILSSLIYKFSERLLVKGLGLIISIVLARLLSPTEFGQIAIIMVFINLSIVLIDSGLGAALVQDKDVSERDYSTVFYISISIAVILICILWLISPVVSDYYKEPVLIMPLRVYSLSLLFYVVCSIAQAKLQREMKFKQMMWCNLIASVVSGCIGIWAAYNGFGIWTLILYYLSSPVITSILLLYAARWYPKLIFSWNRAKILFAFGSRMLVSGFLCSLYNDVRTLIIGKVYSPIDLGYYNRGEQLPTVVSQTLDSALQSVMFPIMSGVQESPVEVKSILKRTLSISALIVSPIMFAMSVMASPIIELLLTSKWLPAVPYMQCICIGCAALPLSSSCLVAIKSMGKGGLYMKLEFIRRLIMLIILLCSVFCFDSVLAIALGFAISSWIDYIVVALVMKALLEYTLREQFYDIVRQLLSALLMSVCMYSITIFSLSCHITLSLQVLVGIGSYAMLCYVLKIESFRYIVSLLRKS